MFFKRLFGHGQDLTPVQVIYASIVAKARQPEFYDYMGVPDSIDGRFDMIALHAILLMNRLGRGSSQAQEFAQRVFDAMFADMDHSLREMGVADLSVAREVRRMAEMFYGRAKAYRSAMATNVDTELPAAIARNIFPEGGKEENIRALSSYFRGASRMLEEQHEAALLAGQVRFPDVSGNEVVP